MEFYHQVYALCKNVPKGKVTTYKELAHALGTRAYRAVGQAMRNNPYAPEVPCHRVVASDGGLGGFEGSTKSNKTKIARLAAEGVVVQGNRIKEFEKRLYRF